MIWWLVQVPGLLLAACGLLAMLFGERGQMGLTSETGKKYGIILIILGLALFGLGYFLSME